MNSIRKYIYLRLKDLISKAGIRLIEITFKDKEGIDLFSVRLGEVELYYNPEKYDKKAIALLFSEIGFALLIDPDDVIMEKIRIAAIELIHYANNANSLIRNSDYISEKLGIPYEKLSRLFSKKTGKTLENFILRLKIEKVKHLIYSQDYTLSEIAYMLDYSSVQYLSNQFKKVTGISVSQYKESGNKDWLPMEEIM